MVPASFDGSDMVFSKPSNMTCDECEAISAKRIVVGVGEIPAVVTCWKLTKEEVDELLRTGRIWVTSIGDELWPMKLTTEKPF